MKRQLFACAVSLLLAVVCAAQPVTEPDEQVAMIPKKGLFTIELETAIYKPRGEGPFPLALINHGKSPGDARFQSRYHPMPAVRYFLQRGYVVAVPMRQGFSKSSGVYIGGGCNVESNGRAQAEDVVAALDYMTALPYVDKTRIIVLGQSHGGYTTLALGAVNYPGVKGLVNFAGGLRQDNCPGWESGLARAVASYAKETNSPSLWFYGDNDSYFTPYTYRLMHRRYVEAGGRTQLVAFGAFGSDSHKMFGSRQGESIWQPAVKKFLEEIGMPVKVVLPEYAAPPLTPTPPRTDFASLENGAAVPYLKEKGREIYKTFLTKAIPRAFAIAPNGSSGWAAEGDDPIKRALEFCNRGGNGHCKLYAVDDDVVWPKQ